MSYAQAQSEAIAAAQPEELGKVLRVPRSKVRRFHGQPRTYFDKDEMKALVSSIKEVGQRTPVDVIPVYDDSRHDYELIDGERRHIACGKAGLETILIIVRNVVDLDEQFESSIVANCARAGHTALEYSAAIERLKKSRRFQDLSAVEQVEKIGRIFGRGPDWVYKHMTLQRLGEDVRAMMNPEIPEEDRLGDSIGIYISSLHQDLQLKIAKVVVRQRMSLNQARMYVRRVAEAEGLKVGTRTRKRGSAGLPSSSLDKLEVFARLTEERLDVLLYPSILAALKKIDVAEREELYNRIGECCTRMRQLMAGIKPTPVVEVAPNVPPTPDPKFDQKLEQYGKVLRCVLYFSDTSNKPHVNLSRGQLAKKLSGVEGMSESNLPAIVTMALGEARKRWRDPEKGTEAERKFVKFLYRVRRDFGGSPNFDNTIARIRQLGSGPVDAVPLW